MESNSKASSARKSERSGAKTQNDSFHGQVENPLEMQIASSEGRHVTPSTSSHRSSKTPSPARIAVGSTPAAVPNSAAQPSLPAPSSSVPASAIYAEAKKNQLTSRPKATAKFNKYLVPTQVPIYKTPQQIEAEKQKQQTPANVASAGISGALPSAMSHFKSVAAGYQQLSSSTMTHSVRYPQQDEQHTQTDATGANAALGVPHATVPVVTLVSQTAEAAGAGAGAGVGSRFPSPSVAQKKSVEQQPLSTTSTTMHVTVAATSSRKAQESAVRAFVKQQQQQHATMAGDTALGGGGGGGGLRREDDSVVSMVMPSPSPNLMQSSLMLSGNSGINDAANNTATSTTSTAATAVPTTTGSDVIHVVDMSTANNVSSSSATAAAAAVPLARISRKAFSPSSINAYYKPAPHVKTKAAASLQQQRWSTQHHHQQQGEGDGEEGCGRVSYGQGEEKEEARSVSVGRPKIGHATSRHQSPQQSLSTSRPQVADNTIAVASSGFEGDDGGAAKQRVAGKRDDESDEIEMAERKSLLTSTPKSAAASSPLLVASAMLGGHSSPPLQQQVTNIPSSPPHVAHVVDGSPAEGVSYGALDNTLPLPNIIVSSGSPQRQLSRPRHAASPHYQHQQRSPLDFPPPSSTSHAQLSRKAHRDAYRKILSFQVVGGGGETELPTMGATLGLVSRQSSFLAAGDQPRVALGAGGEEVHHEPFPASPTVARGPMMVAALAAAERRATSISRHRRSRRGGVAGGRQQSAVAVREGARSAGGGVKMRNESFASVWSSSINGDGVAKDTTASKKGSTNALTSNSRGFGGDRGRRRRGMPTTTTAGGKPEHSEFLTETERRALADARRREKQTEEMRKFAEKVANNTSFSLFRGPNFSVSHGGATVSLPSVKRSQLPTFVGPAGAVRHKGTDFFSDDLPPPRLVAHSRMPVAPKGAIFRSHSADELADIVVAEHHKPSHHHDQQQQKTTDEAIHGDDGPVRGSSIGHEDGKALLFKQPHHLQHGGAIGERWEEGRRYHSVTIGMLTRHQSPSPSAAVERQTSAQFNQLGADAILRQQKGTNDSFHLQEQKQEHHRHRHHGDTLHHEILQEFGPQTIPSHAVASAVSPSSSFLAAGGGGSVLHYVVSPAASLLSSRSASVVSGRRHVSPALRRAMAHAATPTIVHIVSSSKEGEAGGAVTTTSTATLRREGSTLSIGSQQQELGGIGATTTINIPSATEEDEARGGGNNNTNINKSIIIDRDGVKKLIVAEVRVHEKEEDIRIIVPFVPPQVQVVKEEEGTGPTYKVEGGLLEQATTTSVTIGKEGLVEVEVSDEEGGAEVEEEDEDDDEYEVLSKFEAAKDLLPFAGPATLSYCLALLVTVIPLSFVGRMHGTGALNGASVGFFFICVVLWYPVQGMLFAVDTLCSHEYGRDPSSDGLGLILQRGLVVVWAALTVLLGILYPLLGSILSSFYDVKTATAATEFLYYCPIFLFAMITYTAFMKFVANQMLPALATISTIVGVVSSPLIQMILCPLGPKYSMLGMGLSTILQLATLIGLIFYVDQTRKTFGAFRPLEAVHWEDMKTFLRIAIPSAVFVAAEAGALDCSILIASTFGDEAGSAWSALMNTEFLLISLSNGLSVAACAKVGSALGANQPVNAKTYAFTAIIIVVVWGVLVNMPTIFLFFDQMMAAFGADLAEAHKVKYIFLFTHLFEAIEFTCQGIFSGANLNHVGAPLLVASMWGAGVTTTTVLSFGIIPRLLRFIFGIPFAGGDGSGGAEGVLDSLLGGAAAAHALTTPTTVTRHNPHTPRLPTTTSAPLPSSSIIYNFISSDVVPFFEYFEGIVGVSVGTTIGVFVLCPLLVRVLRRLDWESLALQGQIEAGEDEDDEDEESEEGEEEGEEGEESEEYADDDDDDDEEEEDERIVVDTRSDLNLNSAILFASASAGEQQLQQQQQSSPQGTCSSPRHASVPIEASAAQNVNDQHQKTAVYSSTSPCPPQKSPKSVHFDNESFAKLTQLSSEALPIGAATSATMGAATAGAARK